MKSPTQPEPHLQVRRLLAIKRHEQPPPGYFHKFSGDVVARIRAGDRADDRNVLGGLLGESAWLQRVWNFLEDKPLVAGLFGAAACAMVLSVFVMSEKPGTTASAEPQPEQGVTIANISPSSEVIPVVFGEQPASSTDPMTGLDDFTHPKARPASWTIPGSSN
jgi:hypothetical protein